MKHVPLFLSRIQKITFHHIARAILGIKVSYFTSNKTIKLNIARRLLMAKRSIHKKVYKRSILDGIRVLHSPAAAAASR